jgi:hypothetical protein
VRLAASSKDGERTQQILRRLDFVERALREKEAAATSVRLVEPASVNSAPTEPDEAPDSVDESTGQREQVLAREREAAIQFYEDLDVRFEEEARDPSWSANAETALRGAMRTAESTGIATDSVECRSTSCRTVLRHEARRPARGFLDAMVDATASQLGHSFQYEDGRTVIYSFRQQHAEAEGR